MSDEKLNAQQPEGNLSGLEAAFFANSKKDENVAVLAEDLQTGGVQWEKIFFEPQPGETYTIKFLPNIHGPKITHRKSYGNLPDPKRRGKTFHYVSSGDAKTCPVLDLFFDLHASKKNGDALAKAKIDEFLGMRNQACVVIQILTAPSSKSELVNQFRLFTFSTFGPNPEIANLINKKINPDEEMVKNGVEKVDIFDIFESPVLMVKCEEQEYDGKKGRAYGKSDWLSKVSGVRVPLDEECTEYYEFKKADSLRNDKDEVIGVVDEKKPHFQKLLKVLNDDLLSVHNYFAYKEPGDPRNSEDSENYLKEIFAKRDEIVPIIRNAKSIAEIKNYGKVEQTNNDAEIIGDKKQADILKESMPNELDDLIGSDETSQPETQSPTTEEKPISDESQKTNDDLLNEIVS